MKKILKDQIEFFLSNFDGFFHSEQEIQLLLAQHLLSTKNYDKVFIEYCVKRNLIGDYSWDNGKKISIDIVVCIGNDYLPIEIKYRTKRQVFPHRVFGFLETNVELAEQSAQDEGCYGFWKDIKRNEILKSTFNLKDTGFVLFISNDPSYKKPPKHGVMYGPFSIHQDRKINPGTTLDWDPTRKSIKEGRATKFPAISISNSYTINWKKMKVSNHSYILL